jgi:hypothetical protein
VQDTPNADALIDANASAKGGGENTGSVALLKATQSLPRTCRSPSAPAAQTNVRSTQPNS